MRWINLEKKPQEDLYLIDDFKELYEIEKDKFSFNFL